MAPEQNDNQIDKVLQALGEAAPPVGMEARIAERVQHQILTAVAPSRTRNLIANCSPAAAWWRGALTGAATAAAIAICAMLLIQHRPSTPPRTQHVAANEPSPNASVPPASNVNLSAQRSAPYESQSTPCAKPTIVPLPRMQTTSAARELRAATGIEPLAPSHPAPALPLTAQERQLVRLVRTASPAELAVLNPEIEAKRDAEKSAEFARFFPPPPPPEANPDANPIAPPQVNE